MARQKATEYENPTIKISITSNEFRDKPARLMPQKSMRNVYPFILG